VVILAWILGLLACCGPVDRIDNDRLMLSPLFGSAFSC
jgi:hypothetical protein